MTSVAQGAGITCTPNPITTTGTVAVDRQFLDTAYVRNQAASIQHANFRIDGAGEAQQFVGRSAVASTPAVWGRGGAYAHGVYGDAGTGQYPGVMGANTASNGNGVAGMGNNQSGQVLADGSGGAFTGSKCGAFGYASGSALPRFGGYFSCAGTPTNYSYVALWDAGGLGYRCYGNGQCVQGAMTRDGVKAVFSAQAPEPSVEDRGRASLSAGHCRVELDPYFLDCVTIDDESPLDVFVQPNSDCRGVFVETGSTGFDVYELAGGTSDAQFTWRAVGRARGCEHTRFPDAPAGEATAGVSAPPR